MCFVDFYAGAEEGEDERPCKNAEDAERVNAADDGDEDDEAAEFDFVADDFWFEDVVDVAEDGCA